MNAAHVEKYKFPKECPYKKKWKKATVQIPMPAREENKTKEIFVRYSRRFGNNWTVGGGGGVEHIEKERNRKVK